ncbi:MAG: gliding motility-associated C-terminal domain-containing protein [Bacteroidetes bacterium]|nr:gliding motility-associated C-terminal domain-containing protein [Bacteroidota bacterium]
MTSRLLKKISFLLLLTMVMAFPFGSFATHQRAAEIYFHHVSGLTYEITLISYTFTPSPANAYRDFLTIDWDDGYTSLIPRVEKTNLPNDITYNRYVGRHTFAGPGDFTISCEDPNRNGGILNIPNSINVPLFIYSELIISPFQGNYDNSPILMIPPVDNGCVNEPFYHNPGAYDPDGDSLSYRLVPCRGAQGQIIPGYTLPPATHTIHLDSITGDFYWDSPPQLGEYNIAILIEEWRDGIKIGSVLRDMQIIIVACNNQPPVIEPMKDTCVVAGTTLTFPASAYDPPDSTALTLSATGEPFVVAESPASIYPNPATGTGLVTTTFTWPTVCSHVAKQPYRVFFKAEDFGTPVHLVNIRSMQIRVVGPAPENLISVAMGNTINLNWDNYTCQNATGYNIYRKTDSTGYVHGYCQTGVPRYLGYSLIDQLNDITLTTYTDNNHGEGLTRGIKYCYMITAVYPDKAESYASNETCAHLKKDVAVITNVSVTSTDVSSGSIYVAWSKPTEIDTIQAPGPYKYIIYRSIPSNPGQFLAVDSLSSLNDTIYNESFLNTQQDQYKYRIDLINNTPGNRFLIGESQVAPSIYLEITSSDKKLLLHWNNDVPWNNYRFVVYRKNLLSGLFDSIGSSLVPAYADKNLRNLTEYCYYVKCIGSYSAPGFASPLINLSQINCGIPVDNIPPCPPQLKVRTDCEKATNILSLKNLVDSCSSDIRKYYIYFSTCSDGQLTLIDSLGNINDTVYEHYQSNSVIGCYSVIAVDSAGNKSDFSNKACIDFDICSYWLPNVFTPNGGDIAENQLFHPRKTFSSVDHVNMKIFDRWGKEVYSTTDPEINWDGRDKNTHQPCSDGVYYYVCEVYVMALCGDQKIILKGAVTILR